MPKSKLMTAMDHLKKSMEDDKMEKDKTKQAKNIREHAKYLKESQTLLKTAMDGGAITPDEAKEMADRVTEMAMAIAEESAALAEGVPSSEGMGGEEGAMGGIGDKEGKPPMTDDTPMGKPNEEEESEDKKMIAQLKKQMDAMTREKEQTKLAKEYSELYPEPMREAKHKEIMASKDSIPILNARLTEAKTFFAQKTQNAIKVAQQTNEREYEIPSSNGSVLIGGKF